MANFFPLLLQRAFAFIGKVWHLRRKSMAFSNRKCHTCQEEVWHLLRGSTAFTVVYDVTNRNRLLWFLSPVVVFLNGIELAASKNVAAML